MLAVLVKVLLDEHGADGVAQVTIHVGHAEFPARGRLFSPEQDPGGFACIRGILLLTTWRPITCRVPVALLGTWRRGC